MRISPAVRFRMGKPRKSLLLFRRLGFLVNYASGMGPPPAPLRHPGCRDRGRRGSVQGQLKGHIADERRERLIVINGDIECLKSACGPTHRLEQQARYR